MTREEEVDMIGNLTPIQQEAIDAFRERRRRNSALRYSAVDKTGHFCQACEATIEVNEDARPLRTPLYCAECHRLSIIGLMALATGKLREAGPRCFKEADGQSDITGADVCTVIALVGDPSSVRVYADREGCMLRLVIRAAK